LYISGAAGLELWDTMLLAPALFDITRLDFFAAG
jgi:hypothetical protein